MKLIIIGPMASGKSVVGRKLSKKLGLQFFDTDEEIERSAGASISWIFDVEGEEKFREREYQVLNKIIHDGLSPYLGNTNVNNKYSIFPSETIHAEKLYRNRVMLVGESAHVIPPIGAQGLNLGLRDIITFYNLLSDSNAKDPGAKTILSSYNNMRWLDIYKLSLIHI